MGMNKQNESDKVGVDSRRPLSVTGVNDKIRRRKKLHAKRKEKAREIDELTARPLTFEQIRDCLLFHETHHNSDRKFLEVPEVLNDLPDFYARYRLQRATINALSKTPK